ncbi:MAG: protein kinase [Gammaproteobacteria bacterium]|nr:protein kinase [Gammaproteobacteria bacterium]
MSTPPHCLPVGYRLHWYEIRTVLGQGGFGITYLAEDTNLAQPVALKEYMVAAFATRAGDSSVVPLSERHREDFAWGLSRFVAEGRTLAQFDHPSIVRVHSVFEANGTAYLVMRYERGESLASVLERERLLDETALTAILLRIMDGLEQVHATGYIHRDIKPANIYIRADGSPVLLDFGSARQALGTHTQTLTTVVSPGYAPFEQYYSDAAPQGPWTDIYALGATMYRAIAGRSPLAAVDRSKTILAGKGDALVTAREIGAGRYSERFLCAVDHALAFRESERPQSLSDWRCELDAATAITAVTVARTPGSPTAVAATVARQSPGPVTAATIPLPVTASPAPRATLPAAARRKRRLQILTGLALIAVLFGFLEPLRRTDRTPAPADPALTPTGAQTVAASTAIEPDAAAVRLRIAGLLEAARADVAATRLTRPPGDNALEKYRAVLALEPDNTPARDGIDDIVARYLRMAHQAAGRGDIDKATDYLDRAYRAAPGDARIADARAQLQAMSADVPAATRQPATAPGDATLRITRAALRSGDHFAAAQRLTPLAENGDAEAQYQLGVLYALGRGVSQDYGLATRWFRLAAAQGHPEAQHNLDMLLARRGASGADQDESRQWLDGAARAGVKAARERLKSLRR